MKFKEIELKYRADAVDLTTFISFCEARKPEKIIIASGYDHFYHSDKGDESFCRHRFGHDANQLTFKRKTADANNFIRTEHNVNLSPEMKEEQIVALLKEFGYSFNTRIFKNCFVFNYADHTLVYYICYDADMHELGRFLEIEAKEDHPWVSEQEAWDSILALERLFKIVGISPQARIKRSLFEMFRKVK